MSAPDTYQSAAIMEVIKALNWSRLALLSSFDDYGNHSNSKNKVFLLNWTSSSNSQHIKMGDKFEEKYNNNACYNYDNTCRFSLPIVVRPIMYYKLQLLLIMNFQARY